MMKYIVFNLTVVCLFFASAVMGQAQEVGFASYYDKGKTTSNGEPFNPWAYTAAHRTYPFGTYLKVAKCDEPAKSVVVRVNDRGPFVKGVSVDLTPAAFKHLAPLKTGKLCVKIYKLNQLNTGKK